MTGLPALTAILGFAAVSGWALLLWMGKGYRLLHDHAENLDVEMKKANDSLHAKNTECEKLQFRVNDTIRKAKEEEGRHLSIINDKNVELKTRGDLCDMGHRQRLCLKCDSVISKVCPAVTCMACSDEVRRHGAPA